MTMNVPRISLLCAALAALLSGAGAARAQDGTEVVESVEAPEPADPYAARTEVEVTRKPGYTVEEYRVQGRREWIKVTPRNAPSLYLNDRTGIGTMSDGNGGLESDVNLPKWKLGEW